MDTMNIALPTILKDFVQLRVEQGGYSSVSEYVRELIRLDQRQAAQAGLESKLLEGLASGPAKEMTQDDWSELRKQVRQRAAASKKR